MSLKDRFNNFLPGAAFLELQQGDWVELLYKNGWIKSSDKVVDLEKPGEGNMNFLLRVRTDTHSFIVKQSRPWVEKYPQIEAPVERISVEAMFYETVKRDHFFDRFVPALIGFDGKNLILAMEDLGEGTDFTFLYKKGSSLADPDTNSLIEFISHLHNTTSAITSFPGNIALRKLNHTHIFEYPYLSDNGFDLNTIQHGLQELSLKYKDNELLKRRVKDLGEMYLGIGKTLVHGDYYPGSWLKTKSGVKIIDPEFSHYGFPEYDMGVMTAHLLMAHISKSRVREMMKAYRTPEGFNSTLSAQFCGAEIIRRIIGLAQLPLDMTLDEKAAILEQAERMISGSFEAN
ncbi:MAG TPA: phosphotransferase [Chryseolinea sp.]|nr:phosphotransferase [Chryseolinea sp.]